MSVFAAGQQRIVVPVRAVVAAAAFIVAARFVAWIGEIDTDTWWYLTPYRVWALAVVIAGGWLWARRPDQPLGRLVIVWGVTGAIADLTAARTAWLFVPALFFQYVVAAVGIHLALGLPDGRLRTRTAKVLVAVGYVVAVGGEVLRYLIEQPAVGHPAESGSWAVAGNATAIALGVAVAAVLTHRLVTAGPEQRRATGLAWIGAILWTLLSLAYLAGDLSGLPGEWHGAIAFLAFTGWIIGMAVLWCVYRIRELSARVETIAADERRRIRRDLHDGVQQRLYATAILLDLAGQAPDVATRADAIDRAKHNLTDALGAFRRLTGARDTPPLADGLAAALAGLRDDAPIRVVVNAPPGRWAPRVEQTAYFVAAEALANAYRHAQASRVEVLVLSGAGRLRVEVTDDGRGFDTGTGACLPGLRDRVAVAGGTLDVSSRPGHGTTVLADLPVAL